MSIWAQCHGKLLEQRFVYGLNILLGCQRILDPEGAQTFEKGKSQKKWETLWKWKEKVYIVKDMNAITQNSELKFQRLLEHHPL